MDRFIDYTYYCINELENDLKSNMDRFIEMKWGLYMGFIGI